MNKIDLNKFKYEDESIIERLYKEAQIGSKIMTKEEFEKLPINPEYLEYQKNKDDEKIKEERKINLKIFEERMKEKSKVN